MKPKWFKLSMLAFGLLSYAGIASAQAARGTNLPSNPAAVPVTLNYTTAETFTLNLASSSETFAGAGTLTTPADNATIAWNLAQSNTPGQGAFSLIQLFVNVANGTGGDLSFVNPISLTTAVVTAPSTGGLSYAGGTAACTGTNQFGTGACTIHMPAYAVQGVTDGDAWDYTSSFANGGGVGWNMLTDLSTSAVISTVFSVSSAGQPAGLAQATATYNAVIN